ncbi:MAG: class I SAM-dependent methyltransferase family protein [Candidatus Heimdallarchaeota archaeon]
MLLERTCVKVLKTNGETVRRFLLKEGLLDLKLLIEQQGEYLYLPTHPLPDKVVKKIHEKYRTHIETHRFSTIRQKPKTFQELLKETLPKEEFSYLPQGFDRIGDIAIVGIKDRLKQFEKEIGMAILTANSSIKTVFTKDSKVFGSRRLQKLRYIAGQEKYRTIHREFGVYLCVEIGRVYFSPRLAQEHVRIANQVLPNELVLDMFTGVGPFAIHIANQIEGKIYAVDINPTAITCLKENMTLNKLRGEIIPILGDVQEIINRELQGLCDRVIMNLPSKAANYIPAAISAIKPRGGILHFYKFEKEPASKEKGVSILRERAKKTRAAIEILRSHIIKEIAPRTYLLVVDARVRPKSELNSD